MEQVFEHISESDTGRIVDFITALNPLPSIITLEGDLGAGKTTLVKKLIAALGSNDEVSSPTFSLVNEYQLPDGSSLYHSDWYRINNPSEIFDAGIAEYIDAGERMIIEWPEIGKTFIEGLPQLNIYIEHEPEARTYRLAVR